MYLICIYMYTFKNICAYHIKTILGHYDCPVVRWAVFHIHSNLVM